MNALVCAGLARRARIGDWSALATWMSWIADVGSFAMHPVACATLAPKRLPSRGVTLEFASKILRGGPLEAAAGEI